MYDFWTWEGQWAKKDGIVLEMENDEWEKEVKKVNKNYKSPSTAHMHPQKLIVWAGISLPLFTGADVFEHINND